MKILAAALALPLVLTGCPGGGGNGGSLAITDSSGSIEMLGEDGTWGPVPESIPEEADLQLSGSGSFLTLEGSLGNVRMTVASGSSEARVSLTGTSFEVPYGDLVVAASDGSAVSIAVPNSGNTAPELIADTTGGTVRVSVGDSKRLAVYAGASTVTLLGETVEIPSWRQVGFAGGRLPGVIPPLRLDPNDPMDLFAAGDIVALDSDLASVARGFEAEFGARIRSIQELSAIAEDADRPPFTFLSRVLSSWRAGDVLIGLVLALVHQPSTEGSLTDAFREVRSLRDAGASWGVVAAILGLTPTTVTDRVARAVALRAGEIDPGKGDPINTPPSDSPPTPQPSPTPSPSRSKSPSPTPTGSKTPKPSGSSSSSSPPPSSSDPPIPTTPTTPTPTPPSTPTCQPIDQIFGNC